MVFLSASERLRLLATAKGAEGKVHQLLAAVQYLVVPQRERERERERADNKNTVSGNERNLSPDMSTNNFGNHIHVHVVFFVLRFQWDVFQQNRINLTFSTAATY